MVIIWIIEATSKDGEKVYRTDRKRFTGLSVQLSNDKRIGKRKC